MARGASEQLRGQRRGGRRQSERKEGGGSKRKDKKEESDEEKEGSLERKSDDEKMNYGEKEDRGSDQTIFGHEDRFEYQTDIQKREKCLGIIIFIVDKGYFSCYV